MLTIDGSYGEGGGQILRSTLTLASLLGITVQLINIRANRSKPGLRPQHLTAVRAAAALCQAELRGAAINSQSLTFAPQSAPQSGDYTFDVADAARGGSAGSVALVLQTLLLPLALTKGDSRVILRGGTCVPMSPAAAYIEHIYLPTLAEMGVKTQFQHRVWGFYPRGGGEVSVDIVGESALTALDLAQRGEHLKVTGFAFAANLPSHIPQRMADRARKLLHEARLDAQVTTTHVKALGAGTGIFLQARYDGSRAGFTALGRRGLPAEAVAENAVRELLRHQRSAAALDSHLGDQLLLPSILAKGVSRASVSKITPHLLTNIWVASHFDVPGARVEGAVEEPGMIIVGES